MAHIAGFDPSLTHFGWVIYDTEKSGEQSVIDLGTFKTDPKDGLLVQRLITQRHRVFNLLSTYNISFVSMEAPYWGDYSTEILFALNQFLHENFLNLKIFVIYFQPLSLKKYAVPHLNSQEVQKNHMVHQAKTELNRQGKRLSEHVSDAYFAAKLGSRFYNWHFEKKLKDEDLSEEERHVFCEKHTFTRGNKKGITEYTGLIYKENDQFFDYSKQNRNTQTLINEVNTDGFKEKKDS